MTNPTIGVIPTRRSGLRPTLLRNVGVIPTRRSGLRPTLLRNVGVIPTRRSGLRPTLLRNVGIIGVGYVGSALKRYFEGAIPHHAAVDERTGLVSAPDATRAAEIVPAGLEGSRYGLRNAGSTPSEALSLTGSTSVKQRPLYIYDKFKRIGSPSEVNKADIIFVCVPTPHDEKKGFDRSQLEDVFSMLKGNKVVVIRSTVLPGTTDYFQKKYPAHKVLFNPEFLTQSTADADMRYPDRQIIGYTARSYDVAKDVSALLPLAPFERIIPAREAEMIKYFGNTWFATKVIFANQMYDLCQKLGINYDVVKECAAADKRIGRSHLEIWFSGYRGVGGACLPKDTKSLIRFAQENGVDLKLLKTAMDINKRLIRLSTAKKNKEALKGKVVRA